MLEKPQEFAIQVESVRMRIQDSLHRFTHEATEPACTKIYSLLKLIMICMPSGLASCAIYVDIMIAHTHTVLLVAHA